MTRNDTLPVGLATAMVRSLTRGSTVSDGARYIHVGHESWLGAQKELLRELANDGGSDTKFVRGAYGSGKSHFLAVVQDHAREMGWVTAHVECKVHQVQIDRFETLYPRIVASLRLPSREHAKDPGVQAATGHGLQVLVEQWSTAILRKAGIKQGGILSRPFDTESKVYTHLRNDLSVSHLPSTFTQSLAGYVRARLKGDVDVTDAILRWLSGDPERLLIAEEYLRRPEVGAIRQRRKNFECRPIGTGTAHDAMRGLLWLVQKAGHSGLVLCIDEIEELAKLRPRRRQDQALQALREHVDHAGGDVGYSRLCLFLAATPEMFEGPEYFPRCDALATRILPLGPEINWRAPVIDLDRTPLRREQLREIAERIEHVHGVAYAASKSEKQRVSLDPFVDEVLRSRVSIAKPRLLVRVVIDELERARQNGPGYQPPSDVAGMVSRAAQKSQKEM
jgi:hypothetical protein